MATGEESTPGTLPIMDAAAVTINYECPVCYSLGRPPITTCKGVIWYVQTVSPKFIIDVPPVEAPWEITKISS